MEPLIGVRREFRGYKGVGPRHSVCHRCGAPRHLFVPDWSFEAGFFRYGVGLQDSQERSEAITAVADHATKLLVNFPRERRRLLALLPAELGWQSWSNDDGDCTKSAK